MGFSILPFLWCSRMLLPDLGAVDLVSGFQDAGLTSGLQDSGLTSDDVERSLLPNVWAEIQ